MRRKFDILCGMKSICRSLLAAVASFAVLSVLADGKGYTCSMHVGNSSTKQHTTEGAGKSSKNGTSSKSKVVTSIVTWPVKVSLRGETLPREDAVKLKCYFIGVTDGKPKLISEKSVSVSLDEKNNFETDISSPPVKLVHTTTTTRHGGNSNRYRSSRRGNTSTSVKTSTSGTRVTGCIIQLVVNGKTEKSFASNPGWSKFARADFLAIDEVLKIR